LKLRNLALAGSVVFALPTFTMGQSINRLFLSNDSEASSEAVQICKKDGTGCTLAVKVEEVGKKKKCKIKLSPGVLINVDTDTRDITWKLELLPGATEPVTKFRFDPAIGIEVSGDDDGTEFDDALPPNPGIEHKIKKRLNAKANFAYSYNIHVQFNYKIGAGPDDWRRCGTLDPVIINRD
jgi:hypothetical protein